jgi:hypothetical protein
VSFLSPSRWGVGQAHGGGLVSFRPSSCLAQETVLCCTALGPARSFLAVVLSAPWTFSVHHHRRLLLALRRPSLIISWSLRMMHCIWVAHFFWPKQCPHKEERHPPTGRKGAYICRLPPGSQALNFTASPKGRFTTEKLVGLNMGPCPSYSASYWCS